MIMNGVPAKTLIDFGFSDDFIGNRFVTVNKVSTKKRDVSLLIQQVVKGSKPKSNAIVVVNVKFGEWTKILNAHGAGLAGYDAIIRTSTLHDGDAIIGIRRCISAWDVVFDCTIPEDPPKSPKKHPRRKQQSKP